MNAPQDQTEREIRTRRWPIVLAAIFGTYFLVIALLLALTDSLCAPTISTRLQESANCAYVFNAHFPSYSGVSWTLAAFVLFPALIAWPVWYMWRCWSRRRDDI
jgi:hypothetical protein